MAEKPFKNRDDIKKQIRMCERWCDIAVSLAFLLVAIGIIWRVLKIDYGLDSTFWFLLGIFFALISIMPAIHIVVYKQMYGIYSENK
jgi:hypothetical protein